MFWVLLWNIIVPFNFQNLFNLEVFNMSPLGGLDIEYYRLQLHRSKILIEGI